MVSSLLTQVANDLSGYQHLNHMYRYKTFCSNILWLADSCLLGNIFVQNYRALEMYATEGL